MDISVIKQVISNAIPGNVNISDIDIKEGNGKLTVELTWEVLKEKEKGPDLDFFLPKIVTDPKTHFEFMDGYSAYREKVRKLERSQEEANRLRFEYETRKGINDAKNSASILESEDERCLEELRLISLCEQVIAENPTQVAYYRSGRNGNLGFLLSKLLVKDEPRKVLDLKLWSDVLERVLNETKTDPLSDIAKRIKEVGKCKEPSVITVPSITNNSDIWCSRNTGPVNQEYAKALRRAGFSAAQAEELAREKPLKATAEVKTISQVDLKDQKYDRNSVSEERVAQNSHVSAAEQSKATIKKNSFRRPEDGNTIDGYKRVSVIKNPSEVISEYKAAVKGYEKRFGPEFDSRGNRVGFTDVMGKRGVSACSTSKNNISDVEIMLMANEKFTRPITDPPPRPVSAKKEEPIKVPLNNETPPEPPPKTTRFKRILSHLKAIKVELHEMLRK